MYEAGGAFETRLKDVERRNGQFLLKSLNVKYKPIIVPVGKMRRVMKIAAHIPKVIRRSQRSRGG